MKVVGSVLIAASGDLALHEEEVDVSEITRGAGTVPRSHIR